MIRSIFVLAILFLVACSSSNKGTYTETSYVEPIRYDKENGGYLVVNETDYASFKLILNDKESDKNAQEVPAYLPYIAYWKIARNPLGMDVKPKEECGEEPEYPDLPVTTNFDEIEKFPKYIEYKKERDAHKECIKKVVRNFNSQTKYKYYYAKMKPNTKIIYPAKSDMFYRWNISYFIGGVNDLSIEAVPEKYKTNLDKLRTHDCHKWGDSICYDLPNGDKNIYYAIHEEPYIIEDGKKVPQKYYSMDVRISKPLDWVEVEGIEISAKMFYYLEKVCKKTFFCHFNDLIISKYKEEFTPLQKEYIEATKWDLDVKWEPKKE